MPFIMFHEYFLRYVRPRNALRARPTLCAGPNSEQTCGVMYTVEQARGGVVHTPGFTSQSPGGDSCARMMPGVGPRWGRPGCREATW